MDFSNGVLCVGQLQAYERFGDPSVPVEEAAQRLMKAGQSNAVKGEVAGKDSLPTDGVKGSGVTADSMASAVQVLASVRRVSDSVCVTSSCTGAPRNDQSQ